MKLKADKLAVSVYAHHGDTCSLAPYCKSLGCASRCDSEDYVLSARFAYLQEAIDIAKQSQHVASVCVWCLALWHRLLSVWIIRRQ